MGQTLTGFGLALFGLLIGGVGVATAGVGIGIPMIPLGIYLVIRGVRSQHIRSKQMDSPVFERTPVGALLFGALLIIIGVATSAAVIGIPIALAGAGLIVYAIYKWRIRRAR